MKKHQLKQNKIENILGDEEKSKKFNKKETIKELIFSLILMIEIIY